MSAEHTFYYRAYDPEGHKVTGTIAASDIRAADHELRERAFRPYFLRDYHELKKAIHHRRRRQQLILAVGAVAILLTTAFSVMLVTRAGREQAPSVEQYRQVGILKGEPNQTTTETDEEQAFADEIQQAWNTFVPDVVSGMEVNPVLTTIYVNRQVSTLSEDELELLATNTARALHRRFNSTSCMLLIVEGDTTLIEVSYSPLSGTTRVRSYR